MTELQLRDEQGPILTAREETPGTGGILKGSVWNGEDFQLTGTSGALGITP